MDAGFVSGFPQPQAGGSLTAGIDVSQPWLPEAFGATLITGFAAGHGWSQRNGGAGYSVTMNDTTVPGPFATQSITVVNGTGAGQPGAQKQTLALDMTGKSLLVWFKYTNASSAYPGVIVYLSDATFTNYYLGQINGPPGATSPAFLHPPENGWYCVEFFPSQMTLTGSLALTAIDSIRIVVNSSASQGAGTGNEIVSFGGVATRPWPSAVAYPNGVVSFTFDDGGNSDFIYARTVLGNYGVAGTSYVIADGVDGISGSTSSTVAQYRQMQEELGWEVAGHAYTLANHNTRYENLSPAALTAELQSLKAWLLNNGFTSENWASPGGSASSAVWLEAHKYFSSHRNAGYITNWLLNSQQAAPPVRPYDLIAPTWDASSGATVASFKAAIDKTKTNKAWLIFNMHGVTTAASSGLSINTTDLDSLVSYALAQGLAVQPVGSVMKTTAKTPGNADYLAVTSGGLNGATTATRYVGGTTGSAPAAGTFAVGDFIIGATGIVWICVAAGTPGTWRQAVSDYQNFATGIIVPPSGATANSSIALTASRAYVCRFVAPKPLVVTKIAFTTTVAAGSNDNCDVGIFDSTLTTLLGSSGSTAGKMNAVAGVQTVNLLASVTLVPGTVYYAAFAYGTVGTTAASMCMTAIQGNSANLMGSAAPNLAVGFQNTAFPLAGPFGAGPISNAAVLGLLA